MRSENSVKNSLAAIVGQAISLIFGFVTRIVFVRVLGEAYLGVNGVFYSVLSLLSLTELGLGSAIPSRFTARSQIRTTSRSAES